MSMQQVPLQGFVGSVVWIKKKNVLMFRNVLFYCYRSYAFIMYMYKQTIIDYEFSFWNEKSLANSISMS